MMFVFATVTMVNANSNVEIREISEESIFTANYQPCSDLADAVTGSVSAAIGGFVTHIEEINLWVAVYDSCIFAEIRDME
jgi:hypothetical protein